MKAVTTTVRADKNEQMWLPPPQGLAMKNVVGELLLLVDCQFVALVELLK